MAGMEGFFGMGAACGYNALELAVSWAAVGCAVLEIGRTATALDVILWLLLSLSLWLHNSFN